MTITNLVEDAPPVAPYGDPDYDPFRWSMNATAIVSFRRFDGAFRLLMQKYSLGADIRLGHPIGEYSRWNATYRASQDRVSDVNPLGSPELLSEEGTHYTSLIGVNLTRDTRDNVFDPTRGGLQVFGFDFGGVGFGEQFIRTVVSATYFQPLPWMNHVLSFRFLGGYSLGWSNDPVPLFPYPGSPDYRKLWGAPDDRAWERAHAHYLRQFEAFSEIQDERPRPLAELESRAA